MKKVLLCLVAVPLFSACVQTGEVASDQKESKEYVTGSNLPRRDRQGVSDVKVVSPESMENVRSSGAAQGVKGGG